MALQTLTDLKSKGASLLISSTHVNEDLASIEAINIPQGSQNESDIEQYKSILRSALSVSSNPIIFQEIQDAVNSIVTFIQDLEDRIKDLESSNKIFGSSLKTASENADKLKKQLDDTNNNNKTVSDDLKSTKEALEKANKEIENLKKSQETANKGISGLAKKTSGK